MSRCWCTSNPSHCQLSPVCLCERARYLCGRWKSHLQILSYQIPILHFSNTSIKVTIISCCHASLSSQQNLQLLHFFKVIFILSIICEIIFNFDKQHDSQKLPSKAQASSTPRRHCAKKLEEEASNKRQETTTKKTAKVQHQILAEISSQKFLSYLVTWYFWKSLVRGRTILKGEVIVVNVHLLNHVLVLKLKPPKHTPTRTSLRTFLLILFLSLRTFQFTSLQFIVW